MKRKREAVAEDVTEEYLNSAVSARGTVAYEAGLRTKNHQAEIDMARWIHQMFGGDILLLRESEKDSVKRPDYLWKEKFWELKGVSSINGADKLLQYAIKQIQDNPGGVILNVLEDMELGALERQLGRRIGRSRLSTVDLVILRKGVLVKVLRYYK